MRKNHNLPAHLQIMTVPEVLAYKLMPNPEPIEPDTRIITRQGIEVLADSNRTRVLLVSRKRSLNFPPLVCRLDRGVAAYDVALVIDWLKHNDIHALKFTRADYESTDKIMPRYRNGYSYKYSKDGTLDVSAAQAFLSTFFVKNTDDEASSHDRPKQPIERQTVHVFSFHEHQHTQPINAWSQRHDSNHRIAIAGNFD